MTEGHAGTVIVVDDDAPVREALSVLMKAGGFTVVSYASGEALLASQPPEGPACLLLDIQMPGLNGIEVQEQLHEKCWEIPVIFLTAHADVPIAVKALKQGALDFFEKPGFDGQVLIERVGGAIQEHRELLARNAALESLRRRLGQLSQREFQVARLAAAGMSNKVIGMELNISERTVEVHRGRAMKKLGLRSAAELVRLEAHFKN